MCSIQFDGTYILNIYDFIKYFNKSIKYNTSTAKSNNQRVDDISLIHL